MSRALLLVVGMMTPPLVGATFLALQNGFLDFFPGKPIGGVPETRLAGVGRAHQRRERKESASGLVGIILTVFGEQRYECSDGKHHSEKDDDHSYAHSHSPVFD
jgi:hypothetical protein